MVTDPNQLVGGNAGSVTPAVSCEPAIITPCLFNPTETPGTREVRVQIESTNMAPSGSNTGWTQLANITIGGVVFAQYSTTVTVPAKTAAEIPLSNPFSFTITVANTPARFQVFGVASHENTYFGLALSDSFYELSGNIGTALTTALFPASAICNTASNVNKDFMITGNLTINSNFCFDFTMLPNGSVRRGRVFVQPGRTITVNGGATLSVLSADVVGCELLHGGIIIQNSGTVVMTGAEVRDAVTAVTVQRGGTLRAGGSRFFNNITGIKLDGNAGTATAPPAMPVCTTNTFGAWLVDGAEIRLKPLGGGTIGYPRPLFGIDLRNAGVVLASSNIYRRIATYGVQATNTTLDLLTSFFSDINQAGIYFSGKNNLTVTGFGGLANSFRAFDLCPTSIICTNAYGINITNCRMTNTNTGIFLIRNTSPEATIRSNRIEASFHGIRTNMNGRIDPHSQGIRDNSIVINGNNTNSVGVGFEEFPLNSTHSLHWRLQDNTINMQSARQGIKATSGNKYWMLRNTVSVANTTQPDAEGIRLQDVRDSKIECNLVTLNNGGNDNLFPGSTKGYYSASGRTNDFLCNTADNTYYGMQFFDAALDIDMKANAIGNHRYGLALGTENGGAAANNQVTIGQQGTAQSGNGNQWEVNEFAPTTTRTGAKHWSSKAAIWGLSRFFVSDNSNCPTLNPTKNPPANWFTENVPNCQTNHTCNPNCPPPAGGPASESDWLSGEIAAGRTAAAGLLPAGVAKLEAKLFAQLSERAGMMGENEDYPLFYETRNEGNIGKFYNVEVGIGQLFHLAASDSASLRTHRTELDTLMAQIRAMNEAEATSPIDENARQQLYQSARTHDAAIQALLDSLQSERIVAASSLITQNANIVPSEVWEFNQQFVNEFFLTLVAGAEPSGQQVEDLAVIAAACPLTDGDAVYQARSLYAPYNEEAIYDDDNLCQDIEERAAHTRTKRPTGLAVFPNPGQEVFTLTGLMPGAYELDVYDGRGILVLHTVGTERTFRVPGLTCTRPSCAKKAAARRRSSSPSSAESIPSPCPARASSPRAGWAYFLFSMKKTLLLACWAVLSAAYGQRNDFKWVLGYDYDPNTPGTDNILFDFNPNLMEFNYEDRNIEFVGTNAIICDDGGEVKIYTNGCQMYEKDGEMILNSDSINIGYAYQEFCVNQGAYRTIDASMLLPAPERPGFYYYITDGNYYDLTISPIVAYTARLSYNLIDMNAEGGLGRVVEKNVPLLYDTLTGGQIEAVKHANGRDWWVVVPIYNTNIYRFFLVSPSGVALHHSQAIGNKCTYQTVCCQAIFSPDGSKYSRYSNLDDLFIFDFDRCEGMLSNFKYIEVQDTTLNGEFYVNCSGISISPNSKYLYLTNVFDLMQFDLTSDDPASTRQDVAHYDGWSGYEYLCWSQLAPDGKIYITTGNGTRHMHVVHSPDEFGTACEPQISAYKFQKPKFDLPNLPNYRLGPLDGSPCDTLGLDNRPWAHWRWRPEAQALRTVVFRDLSAYEPDTWHWDFGDGTQSDERNPTHTFPTAGDYYVCLTVSNQYGSDTFCRWVTVTTVGTDEAAPGLRASVSPNPATDHFEVRLSGPLPAGGRLSLFDVAGRPVLSEAFEAGTVTARVGLPEGLPPGVYFWQLAAGARVLAKGRVVKADK
ncbi:MAG: PKD domain-containing protein [Saprospiraceae bacterium]